MQEEVRRCIYGCGKEAHHLLKNGKWCCSPHTQSCPVLRGKNSRGTAATFKNGRTSPFTNPSIRTGGWNKGLTKETNETVKQYADTIKKGMANGTILGWMGRHHTNETLKKMSQNGGGIRNGSGRGKKGWYKGYWCDSSWELAWVIYNIDHGVQFVRNKVGFEYLFEGTVCKFYPDFLLEDGSYVEIKGWLDVKNKAKISSFQGILAVIGKREIVPYIKYVITKYGTNFIEQYDKRASSSDGRASR